MKTYVVTHHQKGLDETILIMGHKICFNGEIWKIWKIPVMPFLSGALGNYRTLPLDNVVAASPSLGFHAVL